LINFNLNFSRSRRVDSGRNIHAPLGRVSFDDKRILGNFKSLVSAVAEKKPQSVKGNYFLAAYLSSTMGPSFRVDLSSIDNKGKNYLLSEF
jgi:large subunit ribosomal protein L1